MTRVLIVHGPGADPRRPGLVDPAPGSATALDERCQVWGRKLGLVVHTAWAATTDALVEEVAAGAGAVDGLVVVPDAAGFDAAGLRDAVAGADRAAVALHLTDLRRAGRDPHHCALARAGARVLHGRGTDGYRWALHHLAWRAQWPAELVRYGPEAEQVAELRVPAAETPQSPGTGRKPVVALVHGGFWLAPWERDLMDGLAVDLARRGWATWNLEYRRMGAGGGWPGAADDVAAGLDELATQAPRSGLDTDQVVILGHSVGAQLAVLAATRTRAAVRPQQVVSLAGVLDLAAAHSERLGGGAVEALFDGPPGADDLRDASPLARVPAGIPMLLAHLLDDPLVPVSQTRAYEAAATGAGEPIVTVEHAGADHFCHLDPTSPAWQAVAGMLEDRRAAFAS